MIYLIEGKGKEQYVYESDGQTYQDVYERDGAFCTVHTEAFNGSLENGFVVEREEEIPLCTLVHAGLAGACEVTAALKDIDIQSVAERMYRASVLMVCRRSGMMMTSDEVKAKYGIDLFEKRTAQQLSALLKTVERENYREVSYAIYNDVCYLIDVIENCPEVLCGSVRVVQMLLSYYQLCL